MVTAIGSSTSGQTLATFSGENWDEAFQQILENQDFSFFIRALKVFDVDASDEKVGSLIPENMQIFYAEKTKTILYSSCISVLSQNQLQEIGEHLDDIPLIVTRKTTTKEPISLIIHTLTGRNINIQIIQILSYSN